MKKAAEAADRGRGDWTPAEAEVLGRSVLRAPSVHNTQPWKVELADGAVLLRERTDVALPHHDPRRRDLAMSCGTALANLELAVRVLGRRADIAVLPDPARPDLIASIGTVGSLPPVDDELRRYGAITARRSHRAEFTGLPVSPDQLRTVLRAAVTTGVEARVLPGTAQLAKYLDHAARVIRDDGAYQRELALWTIRDEKAHRHGAGLGYSALPPGELPWAGLVRQRTALPDRPGLRERLEAETMLLFSTAGDARIDHIRAGYALERGWLEAVAHGIAGAVLTQPLHVPEVRSALCEDYRLPGFPHALLRLGRTTRAVPGSPRRNLAEVLGEDWQERG
ncbi:Acg family FMN-binding oxidoreductase [Amycolatopsis panacis]|uniref:Nitroreductase n=1 Tax=Amycolatopsis panacis TaxID=2340917 RepID=A0A419I6T9_9PSEU|nr:nitroreductase family protein [Amycolatopsis panacis]RJQ87285.1 nitroreductase [Amycolatopsis panacis]